MTINVHGNRRYVITGAASGIGLATTERLLEEGAVVHAVDIDVDGLRLLREAHPAAPVHIHHVDATSPEQWAHGASAIAERSGSIDGCLLNIGRNSPGRLGELTESDWQASLRLNLDANVHGFQALLPLVSSGASIVFTTSIHGFLGFRSFPGYAAAKGALTALTRQLAVEYAPDLRVNAIAPGAVLTAIWNRRDEDFRRTVASRIPLMRIADAKEIAAAAAFLLSPDASYITGQTLVVDGGRSISSGE